MPIPRCWANGRTPGGSWGWLASLELPLAAARLRLRRLVPGLVAVAPVRAAAAVPVQVGAVVLAGRQPAAAVPAA
jgi:hypothetical protein